ncbi:MAG: rod shape-determining protein MreC [Candidatus Paceibacterota bacterium]
MKRYILAVSGVILIIIIFFTGFFIKKERFFDENLQLKKENENLKAEVQKHQALSIKYQEPIDGYLTVKVFSTYPFNIKNQIAVNAGEAQGIKKSMPALFGKNILLGQVIEVSKNSSVIQTIFDPNWQLPVRIGEKQTNGLLQGGNEPKITFIEKDKPITVGDAVYSAKQGFPLGLKVGEISDIKESAPGVFKEAVLTTPFNVSDLREVEILLQ